MTVMHAPLFSTGGKIVWAMATLPILALFMVIYAMTGVIQIDLFLILSMAALALPTSGVLIAFLAFLPKLPGDWPIAEAHPYTYLLCIWLLFWIAGYLQYFVLVPWLKSFFKRS